MPAGSQAAHQVQVLEEADSPLLRIPPELRLAIYEFALFDSPCVTVGHAEVVGKHHDVVSVRRRVKSEEPQLTATPPSDPPPLWRRPHTLPRPPSEPHPPHRAQIRQLPPLRNPPSDHPHDLLTTRLDQELLHPPESAARKPPDQRRAHEPPQTPQEQTDKRLRLIPIWPAHPQDDGIAAVGPGTERAPGGPLQAQHLQYHTSGK